MFVLREVFGFGFGEVASAVGRSEAACRQLAVRRAATWTRDALGSRRIAGSEKNSPSGSSMPSGRETWTGCGTCWPPTCRWSATVAARPRCGARVSSAPTTCPGCWPRSSRRSSGSAVSWSRIW
ncbi:hypothetical protein [Nonomuraea sp. NPDC003804]|uniref:hypothetical protein n=1 Tax=Nonomuraea sp. NPDC003804 TaxID=3154547 RepID=UPI0033A6916B